MENVKVSRKRYAIIPAQKGAGMKINPIGITFLMVVVSSVYYGCVVVEDRALFSPTAVITGIGKRGFEANKTKLTKLDAEIEAGVCHVKLSIDPETGKIIRDSLKTPPGGGCSIEHTDQPLTINGKKVLDIGAVQFTTEGSCRYCWINSVGGMSCVKSENC